MKQQDIKNLFDKMSESVEALKEKVKIPSRQGRLLSKEKATSFITTLKDDDIEKLIVDSFKSKTSIETNSTESMILSEYARRGKIRGESLEKIAAIIKNPEKHYEKIRTRYLTDGGFFTSLEKEERLRM